MPLADGLLVDTNLLASDISTLKARLAAPQKPPLGLFNTHARPDHFLGGSHSEGTGDR